MIQIKQKKLKRQNYFRIKRFYKSIIVLADLIYISILLGSEKF